MPASPCAWRCRLYPEPGSTLYVRALVFDRRKDLLRHWRRSGSSLVGRAQCQAMRVVQTCAGRRRVLPVLAEISFWRREIDIETVGHEVTHAALAWAHRRDLHLAEIAAVAFKGIPDSHPEERLARVIGTLTNQFVGRAGASGLYR